MSATARIKGLSKHPVDYSWLQRWCQLLTLSKSKGWVQAAAPAEASPPRYHLWPLLLTVVTFLGSDALTEATIVLFSLFLFLLVSKCLNHVFVLVREVKFFLLDHAGLKGGRGRGQRALVASHVVCKRVSSSLEQFFYHRFLCPSLVWQWLRWSIGTWSPCSLNWKSWRALGYSLMTKLSEHNKKNQRKTLDKQLTFFDSQTDCEA